MRKVILIVVLIVVSLLMAFLVRECSRKLAERKLRAVSTPLPDFTFKTLDGADFTRATLRTGIPLVLFRMHPECEQCQSEAEELKKHLDLFAPYQVVVLSSAPLEMFSAFVEAHGLSGHENVIILHDPDYKFEDWFGDAPYPTAIVYGSNHTLTAHFPGGAKMELIRKKLESE